MKRRPIMAALPLAVFAAGNLTALAGISVEMPWISVLGLVACVVAFWIDDV